MRGKKKKLFLKIMGFIIKFLMIMTIVLIIVGIFIDRGTDKLLYDVVAGTAGGAAIISVILVFTFPESIDESRVKAYKFKKDFSSYKDFINYLDRNINKIKYKKYDLNNYENFDVYYYTRKGIIRNKVEYFVVLKKDIISSSKEEFLSEIEIIRNKIINDIQQYFKIKVKTATDFAENYIVLVNEETNDFKKIVNINAVGGYRYSFLVCGYSFNSKTLYVANQRAGQFFNYIYIRNKFLKVMNLKLKEKIN